MLGVVIAKLTVWFVIAMPRPSLLLSQEFGVISKLGFWDVIAKLRAWNAIAKLKLWDVIAKLRLWDITAKCF